MLPSNSGASRFMQLALFLVGACASAAVSAHPHVWVTVETEVVYNEHKAIAGFQHKWSFDEAYSRFAVEGRDLNNDGQYDREELRELAEVNIASLKEFDFFTFPKVANKLVEREPPKDYWLEYHNGTLTLFFTLPLKTPIPAPKIKDFSFAVYDPTMYVDFAFAKDNPVRLSAAPPHCAPVVREPDPRAIQRNNQTLSGAAGNSADASSSIAEQYAKSVSISCPAT
jgi:ABC-type uncharacterized transport system substrate-binding protein